MSDKKAFSLNAIRDSERHIPLTLWQRLHLRLRWLGLHFSGTPIAGILGVPKAVQQAYTQVKAMGQPMGGAISEAMEVTYTPDRLVENFANPVMNPVVAFHEALMAGGDPKKCSTGNPFSGQNIRVSEAWLFEAQADERGRILKDKAVREAIGSPWPTPTRTRHVKSHEAYLQAYAQAKNAHENQSNRAEKGREIMSRRREAWKKLVEDGFISGADQPNNLFSSTFDPNQYSEYAPLMGGPYFRQLYIYDFLQQVAYAFEAQNHNPLAKSIIRILTQYALGRRFDVQIDDKQKENAWNEYEERTDFTRMICEYWGKEAEIYGEFDFDWENGISIDPSTIWDIITDPDRVDIEYYAYQSYPTAYQMFTGFKVPGEPGADKQKASEYIIRQIPASKLLRMKLNCVSNEKRGRSTLFSILGWLKRVKDLYNAQVIREWLYSCFMWDVSLKNANQSDINAYVSANTSIPLPGSKNIHNDAVTVTPMPAIAAGGGRGGSVPIGAQIMCFIAVAVGIPKEFLNIEVTGGGNRAAALTSAEPFTKMIEDIQARWEWFVTQTFKRVVESKGLKYKPGDIEITFPSVTKDTTTETLQNLTVCEEMKWFTHERCQNMAAKEMNVTQYDAEEETKNIKKEERAGVGQPNPAMPPGGRFGKKQGMGGPNDQGGSEIHGQGKVDLSDELQTL